MVSPVGRICLQCGAEVARLKRLSREYCSDSCYDERKKFLRRTPAAPKCSVCGNAFIRSSNRQKCCAECRDAKDAAYQLDYVRCQKPVLKEKRKLQYAKDYVEKPERLREIGAAYRRRNADRIKAKSHTPEYRLRARESLKKRLATNPKLRLKARIGGLVWAALKGKKAGRAWETLLGYTTQDLMHHLARQFRDGMTWENYGQWHVDHIRPVSSFEFSSAEDPEFLSCWALSNLQPLWALENKKKSNRWIDTASG